MQLTNVYLSLWLQYHTTKSQHGIKASKHKILEPCYDITVFFSQTFTLAPVKDKHSWWDINVNILWKKGTANTEYVQSNLLIMSYLTSHYIKYDSLMIMQTEDYANQTSSSQNSWDGAWTRILVADVWSTWN